MNYLVFFHYFFVHLHDYPSQNGLFVVSLHPHNLIWEDFYYTVNLYGLNDVPSCDPSQKGCFKLWPQLHQRYNLSWSFGFYTVIGPITGDIGLGDY